MNHIFLSFLWADIHRKKGLLLILLVGIIVTMYCICEMLGIAVSEYEMAKNWSDYSSLIVNPGDEQSTEIRRMNQLLDRAGNEEIANIIYLTKSENGLYIVGWDGTEQTRWFPHSSGRFFTEEEVLEGEKVAYVSEQYQKDDRSKEIKIGDDLYTVIGVGWMGTFNFNSMIPDESKVHLFTEETPYDDPNTGRLREEYFRFIVIPASCYLESFEPDQILIQFNDADNKKLKTYKKTLKKEFPKMQVCLPKHTAETRLAEKTIVYIRKSLILSLIAGLTLFQLVLQWVKASVREFSVYHLCGLTSAKILWMIYGRLLCYFLTGTAAAALLQKITLPLMQIIYREETPSYLILGLMMGLVFLFISAATLPLVFKEVRRIGEDRNA
ncbi:MAG: ABC transporter permease [Firmicutes bacterium]|nr:ABC transporter permease [Bacillota bacterium]